MLAEAHWRKFEYTPQDPALAQRAGEQAGVALTLDQSYAPAHVVLAMINYGHGRYDGALGEAQRAVSLDPTLSRAWRELGRAHFRLGQREDAEKDFLKAVSLDRDDWTAQNSLGSFYLSVNRLDDAIREYERMQALAPDNTRAYNNLGTAYLQQERFDKATEMYERSLSLDKNATAYSNLGTALYQQGLYADAARSFEGAVALPGATFLHWFNLGAACYWAPDLRGRAKEAYATAIKLGEQARATARSSRSGSSNWPLDMPCWRFCRRAARPSSTETRRTGCLPPSTPRRAMRACWQPWRRPTKSLAIGGRPWTGSNRRSKRAIQSSGSNGPPG